MKYLIALDESEHAKYAFNFAKQLFTTEDHVYLLSIAEDVFPLGGEEFTPGTVSAFLEINSKMEEEKRQIITSFGHQLTEIGIPHTLLLGKGNAKETILKEASELKVDVVVLGRRGLSRLQKLFIGSVSEYCAQNLDCNVLVVQRPPHDHDE